MIIDADNTDLKTMLEIMRDMFGNGNGHQKNLWAMVLDEGQAWFPASLPDDFKYKTKGFCFDNAIEVFHERGLTYVEGFAYSSVIQGMPIHHAWNVTEDGTVVDTTWREVGVEYFGVVCEIKGDEREAYVTPLGVMV